MTGIGELRAELIAGRTTPEAAVTASYRRLEEANDPALVITLVPMDEAIARARALVVADAERLPLWGVPFVVKDNIDVAAVPTTAGCPAFGSVPSVSATVVRRLERAGAIPVAKVNLDQFATGLVGTRSPYGTPLNPFDPGRVPGGSSSGSAVAVSLGVVPFALGTDTAGSGRVPAAFTGTVGAKPTRGWLSTTGVVPAVRTLDCVSVSALTVEDAWLVLHSAGGYDPVDPYSRTGPLQPAPRERTRFRVGVGAPLPGGLVESVGEAVAIDLEPFLAAGRLLYDGPWVAERFAAVGAFVDAHPDDVDPVVGQVIRDSVRWSAVDAAAYAYELASLRRQSQSVWEQVDALVLPTVPRHPTLAEVAADPVRINAELGTFTSFANLLDLCAVAVPAGIVDGLPVGVMVVAPAWADGLAAGVASRIHAATGGLRGVTGSHRPSSWWPSAPADGGVELAVVGAHLAGQPLHRELLDLGATLVARAQTSPNYRLFALGGPAPPRPGLLLVDDGSGVGIEVEVYRLTTEAFGRFVAAVRGPLCIGTVSLDGDRSVAGFLCESAGLAGATDVSAWGGWRSYLASR